MNLVCATGGQKLELSETSFARDFNPWVISATSCTLLSRYFPEDVVAN